MKINCSQFEGLITFYMDGELTDSLKHEFEEHLEACPHCKIKYKIIQSIISDIKGAYAEIYNDDKTDCIDLVPAQKKEYNAPDNISEKELSAYIDNELPDEYNVKIRKNIIAKPKMRTKLKKMYKLKKIISDSFKEEKTKLKTDFSKEIIKTLNKTHQEREVYLHCTLFIFIVVSAILLSIWAIFNVV